MLVTYWTLDMLGSGDRVWLALLLADDDDDDKGSLWEVGFICGGGLS
jgi:nucleoside 2-deoxyribosyltransferase